MAEETHNMPFCFLGKQCDLKLPHPNPHRLKKYNAKVCDPITCDYEDHSVQLVVHNKHLYVNGHQVHDIRWGHNHVSWTHYPKEGECSSGVLAFTHGGRMGSGNVNLGAHPREMKENFVQLAMEGTKYPCFISHKSFDDEKDAIAWIKHYTEVSDGKPPQGYSPTFTLEIGTVQDDDIPRLLFKIDDTEVGDSVAIGDKDNLLEFRYDYDDMVAISYETNHNFPASVHGYESWDGSIFYGCVRKFDPDRNGPSGKFFAIWGAAIDHEAPTSQIYNARAMVFKTAPAGASGASVETFSAGEIPLSVNDLHSISADASVVSKRNGEILTICMKYCMEGDVLDLFKENPPPIKRLPLVEPHIEEGREFFKKDFAYPFVASGVSAIPEKSGGPKHPITSSEQLKVDYFLAGKSPKCMSNNPSYNEQNSHTYLQAYLDNSPRLQEYINDQNKHHDKRWAKNLFDRITKDAAMFAVVNQMYLLQNFKVFSNNMVLLRILDTSGELSNEYQNLVLASVLAKCLDHADIANKKLNSEWMPDMIHDFVKKYQDDPGSNAPKEAASLHEIAAALKEAATIANGYAALVSAIADAFGAVQSAQGTDSLLVKVENVLKNWAGQNSKFVKIGNVLGKVLMVVGWAAGLVGLVTAFSGFDKDAVKDVAQGLNVIQLAAGLIQGLPAIGRFAAGIWTRLPGFSGAFSRLGRFLANVSFLRPLTIALAGAWGYVVASRFGQWVSTASAQFITGLQAGVAKIAQFFALGWVKTGLRVFVRILGPLVALGNAIYLGYNFVNELLNHDTDKVGVALDGTLFGLAVLELGVVTGGAIAASLTATIFATLASVLSIVGAVLAVVGVVIALVQIFRPHPKPDSPLDMFMDKFRSWLSEKEDPPPDWTPPYYQPDTE